MAKEQIVSKWTVRLIGSLIAVSFSFTGWTAVRVIALEKQTFSYQAGATAKQKATDEKFESYCRATEKQQVKVEKKLDQTYDTVIRIETRLNDGF